MVINFHWNNTRPRYGKCFSNQRPPRDANSVTAAGLRASNTRYTFVMAGVGLAVVHSGLSQHSVRYSDEYYFSTFFGRACTNLTGRWQALFARYFWLRGCWPSGFPINITRIITKSGGRHRSGFGLGYGYPGKIQCKRRQSMLYLQKNQWRFPEWARESYMGFIWDGPYSKTATGQDPEYRLGPHLRGLADDVTLHQYGACNICRSFSDAVCITTPATTVCIRKRRCRSRAL